MKSMKFTWTALVLGSGLCALTAGGLRSAGAAEAELPGPPATQPAAGPTTRPSQAAVLALGSVARLDVPYVDHPAQMQKLDIYAPAGAKAAPVVLYVHGGEWARGDKSLVSYKPRFLNENGVVFVSMNYRLSGTDPHPAQVNDVAAALLWVRGHIAAYGGDPHRIVLVGHSAGCHIVTLVGLDPRPLATVGLKPDDLAGVVSWSGGAFDLVKKVAEAGMYAKYIRLNFGAAEAGWHDASPVAHVGDTKVMPPFLIVSAGDENPHSVLASQDLATQIRAAGGSAKTVLLPGKTHFSADHEVGMPGDSSGQALLDFIRSAGAP
jgi:acetyl esterase/lipase